MDDSLKIYLKGRSKWVQTLAVQIANHEEIDSHVLAELCYKEANNIKCDQYKLVDKDAGINDPSGDLSIFLNSISSPKGINALTEASSLDFSRAPMSLVYGSNGSGKSSYARIIKSICGLNVELLPNIFKDEPGEQSINLAVTINDEQKSGKWILGKSRASQLRNISIFDGQVVDDYVDQQTLASTDPFEVRFLKQLINVIDEVQTSLKNEKDALHSKLPFLPLEHCQTETAKIYTSLNSATDVSVVKKSIEWLNENEKRKKLLETTLAEDDPIKVLVQKRKDRRAIEQLRINWKEVIDHISRSNLVEAFEAREIALTKRAIADESAKAVFKTSTVDGVGTDTWKSLWEAARKYSQTEANPDVVFPHFTPNEDHCPLCHQILDGDDVARLQKFEDFVVGELEATAATAEKRFQTYYNEFPIVENQEAWSAQFAALDCSDDVIASVYSQLHNVRRIFDVVTDKEKLPVVDVAVIEAAIESKVAALDDAITAFVELVEASERQKLVNELKELKSKEWIEAQETSINDEIKRLKKLRSFDRAISKTNTSGLTRRINQIVESHFINDYQERFASELKILGAGRIGITPAGLPQGKGKVSFELQLENTVADHENREVLSDGERRIVALAAFLADMSMKGEVLPFVFDDPISSLDQDYEEKVAERLVELSKTRQVIVFTHRLSLKTLLTEGIKQVAKDARGLGIQPNTTSEVITLQRINSDVGIVTDSLISEKSLPGAFQNLLDRCREIEKLDPTEDHQHYLDSLRLVCTDFRTLVERSVEEKLLNDVVKRYRRSIVTKDKLLKLTRITEEDARLLEGMMTKYSAYEHSQPIEAPVQLPELDDLRQDIEHVKTWEKRYLKP